MGNFFGFSYRNKGEKDLKKFLNVVIVFFWIIGNNLISVVKFHKESFISSEYRPTVKKSNRNVLTTQDKSDKTVHLTFIYKKKKMDIVQKNIEKMKTKSLGTGSDKEEHYVVTTIVRQVVGRLIFGRK
jgi:hypothetical protein